MRRAAACLLLYVALLGCGAASLREGQPPRGRGSRRGRPRGEEGELTTFEVPLTRYIGRFAKNGSSGARPLGDYVRVHALAAYARLDLRASGTEGRTIEILIDNLHAARHRARLDIVEPLRSSREARPEGAHDQRPRRLQSLRRAAHRGCIDRALRAGAGGPRARHQRHARQLLGR